MHIWNKQFDDILTWFFINICVHADIYTLIQSLRYWTVFFIFVSVLPSLISILLNYSSCVHFLLWSSPLWSVENLTIKRTVRRLSVTILLIIALYIHATLYKRRGTHFTILKVAYLVINLRHMLCFFYNLSRLQSE